MLYKITSWKMQIKKEKPNQPEVVYNMKLDWTTFTFYDDAEHKVKIDNT